MAAMSDGQISKLNEAWAPLRPLLDGLYLSYQTGPLCGQSASGVAASLAPRLRQLKHFAQVDVGEGHDIRATESS